jgi:mRNA-degrading endonuclease toxin of MazEF toxin-antitoxin module
VTGDIRTGAVFWCEKFPGLHGHEPKERYCVVISPAAKLPRPKDPDGAYLVVPTSTSSLSAFALPLPSLGDNPQSSSGLPRACCAVCDEYKLVKREVLTRYVGHLRTPTVTKLQELVAAVVQARLAAKRKEQR